MKVALVIILGIASIFALCLSLLSFVADTRGDRKEAAREFVVAVILAVSAIVAAIWG